MRGAPISRFALRAAALGGSPPRRPGLAGLAVAAGGAGGCPGFVPALPRTTSPALAFVRNMSHAESAVRPDPDQVIQDIADYVHNYKIDSPLALETARLCLIDTIGCGLEALRFPACANLLGPVVEETVVPNGVWSSPCWRIEG